MDVWASVMRGARERLGLEYISDARPAAPWEARRAGEEYGVSDRPDWRDVDWQDHLRQVKVAGRRINYVDFGVGDDETPMLFVHGLAGCWQNWLENLAVFAQDRRVVALDLPGFGASDMPADKITISGYGRWVERFCTTVGLDRSMVVGNSMGGFIAAEMAVAYPERVERLVLASSAGISVTHVQRPVAWMLAAGTQTGATVIKSRLREVAGRPRARHMALATAVRHPTRLSPDMTYELLSGAGTPGFRTAFDAIVCYDMRERLTEIECPTLIVWGSEDLLVPVRDADEFARRISRSHKVVLDDTGHVPMIERPIAFNECVRKFLRDEFDTSKP